MIALACDVLDEAAVQRVVDTIQARHGYINLLVNNAGVAHNILPKLPGAACAADIGTFQAALLQAGTRDEFTRSFEFNVTAQYYATVLFLGLLDAGNRRRASPSEPTSQVITVTSGGAFRFDDKMFSVSYTLSKSAGVHLGKTLAHFLKDWQIRSNVLAPGFFHSGECALGLWHAFFLLLGPCVQRVISLMMVNSNPENRDDRRFAADGRAGAACCTDEESRNRGRHSGHDTVFGQQG
jgi:NAD(P)-dependent dehydrogenase (short-subunit alcohol dehydrogenase family)